MRPIKYRAWDKTEKKMYDLRDMYFNVSIDHPRVVFEMPFEMVDEDWKDHDLVLLEFTGLTDRNGTEIYEGNSITATGGVSWNGSNEFEDWGYIERKGAAFYLHNQNDEYLLLNDLIQHSKIEITGNKFEGIK